MTISEESKLIAGTILEQLGGNKFITMTGAKNFFCGGGTLEVPNFYMSMKIGANAYKINFIKITLSDDDTYIMNFSKRSLSAKGVLIISNEKIIKGVYCDMLQDIFTEHTGMNTYL